jgi:hypothetical protein
MGKFPGVGDDLFPDDSDGAFGANIPADAAQAADIGFKIHPFLLPDDELHRAKINTSSAFCRAELIINCDPADEPGHDLDGLGAADLQALGTAQTETGVWKDLTLVLGQLYYLPGASTQADPAAFGAISQGVGNQAAFRAAPMVLAFGQGRTGLRALGGIQSDGRIERTETVMSG